MASKLSVYRGAALALGERRVGSLTENTAIRRRLDAAWDNEGVKRCLKRGLWNFAIRTVRADYSPSVETDFGYRRAFDKPEDWVRTAIVASDEYFRCVINRYSDEAGFLFTDWDFVYWKFVSDSDDYGMNIGSWPENFAEFVEHSLAHTVMKATEGCSQDEVDQFERKVKRKLIAARSTDAMDEPTQFTRSMWAESRNRGWSRENG